MRPLPRLSPTAALLVAAPPIVACAWGVYFAAGGLSPGATELIAGCTTLTAAIALALAALGWIPVVRDRVLEVAVGGLALFAIVACLSATWSLSPATSVSTALLAGAYTGALVLGWLLAPALRRPGTWFAIAITAVATLASTWALVARSFVITTGVQFTPRLSGTLSLPNAMAITALAGTIGGLALTAHANPRLRAAGGAVTAVNALALVLTSSRSGLGLALIAIVVLQLILPAGRRMRLIGLATVVPPLAIGFRVATWPAFTDTTKVVAAAGWRLAALTVIAAAVSAALAAVAPRVLPGAEPTGERHHASRRTTMIALGGIVAIALAAVARIGGPAAAVEAIRAGFTGPVGQTGVRIGIGSNFRDHWWSTAWHGFLTVPLEGTGAGTFRLLEQITRAPAYTTGSAHNTLLEVLAGTGLIGAVPFAVGSVAIVMLAVRGIRRVRPEDAVGATAVALMAFGLIGQGLVDVDWSLIALGVPLFAGIAAIGAPHRPGEVPDTARRGVATVLAVLLVAGGLVAFPFWYSARAATASTAALATDPIASLRLATIAQRLNPLAVEPLLAQADAYAALDEPGPASQALTRALEREPRNYEPWLAYGTYLAYAWGDLPGGRRALERAAVLSGDDPSVRGVLDTLPAQ